MTIVAQNTSVIIDNNWKKWIASNLIKGVTTDIIANILIKNGFTEENIEFEIKNAINSPYIQAAKEVSIQLKRRDWLLTTKDELAKLDSSYHQDIERINTPDFQTFIKKYYSKHLPVVLQNGINHWEALKKWSPRYFAEHFGDKEIQIQYDRETDAKFELNSAKLRKNFTMAEFVNMIENSDSSNNFYMTANNTAKNLEAISECFEDLGDFGEGYRRLSSDPSMDTFFWLGPKGTFTPLHFDLTNNMLIQIYGSKKITLIPANQTPYLYNNRHVFSDVDYPNVDFEKHRLMKLSTPVEVTISAGEALFIPIGWWHCVEGLEDSISISFTNFNAPNHFSKAFKAIQ